MHKALLTFFSHMPLPPREKAGWHLIRHRLPTTSCEDGQGRGEEERGDDGGWRDSRYRRSLRWPPPANSTCRGGQGVRGGISSVETRGRRGGGEERRTKRWKKGGTL